MDISGYNCAIGSYNIAYICSNAAAVTTPTVTTSSPPTSITSGGATCGGNLTSTGGASTTRGICYMQGTSGNPTTSNSTVSAGSTTSTGTFSVNLTGLSASTTYRYRAYATNSAGTSYGSTYSFTTSSAPSAESIPFTDNFETNTNWQTGGGYGGQYWTRGTAANNGGSYGLYVTNESSGTYGYNNYSNYASSGSWQYFAYKTLSLLEETYTVSYDWRANGESTCDYLRVALVPANETLTDGNKNNSISSSGLPSGWLAADGGSKLNLTTEWTASESHDVTITSAGNYNLVFIWVNDYSVQNQPPAAIDNVSVTTLTVTAPTVTTSSEVTRRPSTSIIGCGGNLTSTGGGETERGICYIVGTSGTPTYSDSKVSAGNTTSTGSFTVDLTGLTPNTSYRCRAYAKNSAGTAYGDTYTFTTHWLTQDSGTAGAAPSEYSEKLFDYSTGTKWCVTSVSNTYVIFHADRPVIPQQYIFTTANDGLPARNPKDWTISGANELLSESSASWTTIETVTDNTEMPSTLYTPHTFDMQERPAQAYQYFKFKVTAVQSGSTFQLSELDLVPYPITCTPSQASPSNGYIEATTWPAVAGNPVTIKIHPASGYKLGTITAYKTGDLGTTVTLTGSGDTEGSTRTFTMPGYDVTVSASFVLDSYTITVNTNTGTYGSVSGSGSYAEGSTPTITATAKANGYFYKWSDGDTNASRTITVTGNATYTAIFVPKNISSTTDWDNFAAAVSGTGNYSGNAFNYSSKIVYLTANVGPVTTIVGTSGELSFQGTFDGQCHTLTINYTSTGVRCAPFHTANNATFQNLKIAGTINTSHQQAAGLVGYVHYNCYITNCISDVTISSSINGTGVIGGFVGQTDSGSHSRTYFSGCAFTGKLLGTNTTQCGGFVGFNYSKYSYWGSTDGGEVSFTDCVFAPAQVTIGVGTGISMNVKSATFSRSFGKNSSATDSYEGLTFTNCYYTQSFGTVQGTQCYTITPGTNTTVALTGTTTHDYTSECSGNGLIFYDNDNTYTINSSSNFDNGFSFKDGSTPKLYAAGNVTANLLLGSSDVAGSTLFNYTATPGELAGTAALGSGDPYTLTMTAADQTVSADLVDMAASGTWPDHTKTAPSGFDLDNINSAEDLAWVISLVNGLNGESAPFSGTITLTADIDASVMDDYTWVPIGTVERPFAGTFNGNGHTISGITRSAQFPYQGLFGYVKGGTIHDVVVNTNISGDSHYTGGVAGYLASDVNSKIYNTGSTGAVTAGSNTIAVGGTVGYNAGLVHSSFAVGTVTGQTGDYVGGLVGDNHAGRLFNGYSDATGISGDGNNGGLVGSNSGTVANCYVAGVTTGKYAFAHTNSATIQYCYANNAGSDYCSSGSASDHGLYGAVASGIKDKDYMYRDNYITLANSVSSTTYVPQSGATTTYSYYDDDHTIKWNGLVSALNQWVTANKTSGANISTLSSWYRPLTTAINGDLPVLGFSGETTLGASGNAKALKYGTLDALLTAYSASTASVFLYGSEGSVAYQPGANTDVYLHEDAVLVQSSHGSDNFARTTAGVTFDNSCGAAHDYIGNVLQYDWHLMSTPLNNAAIGISYNDAVTHSASSGVDISGMNNGFFPNGLPTALHQSIKWDLYAYDNVNHLWINFKRNKNNHFDVDGNHVTYAGEDQDGNKTGNFIRGKGYMTAISQPTYMCSTGTLNNTTLTLTLNNGDGSIDSRANLLGNPYHGYLCLDSIASISDFRIYDADLGVFSAYSRGASRNTRAPSKFIHPHQGFFVVAPSGGGSTTTVTLRPTMAGTTKEDGSYFRDDEHIDYPLVNLFAENAIGQRDMTVIELHRPELGGSPKLDQLRNADFEIAARLGGERYALLFTPEGTERVPVTFSTETDGTYKLMWDTQNGEFYSLLLIDNKTGLTYDMLAHDSYTFEASADDYASRFYITYECSGTGIDENGPSTGSGAAETFAYINNGNIVIDGADAFNASLQIIDVLGRMLYSKTLAGTDGACTVSTHGLAKGVYILRLSSNQGVKSQKIVLQ